MYSLGGPGDAVLWPELVGSQVKLLLRWRPSSPHCLSLFYVSREHHLITRIAGQVMCVEQDVTDQAEVLR